MRFVPLCLALFALPAFASQTPCTHWVYEYPDGGEWDGGLVDGGMPADVTYVCKRAPYPSGGCAAGGPALMPALAAAAAVVLRRTLRTRH